MKSPNDAVAARIIQIRQRKNITQHTIAKALNICDSAYSRLEAGETEITINKLFVIAGVLKEEIPVLMGLPQGNISNSQCFIAAQYSSGTFHFSLDEALLQKLRKSE